MVLIFLTWISLCHFLPFSFDLGTVNGVAASCSFLTRILSPILCGITMSWSCAKERAFPFDFHFTFLKLATTVMLSCILICLVPKSLNKQLVIEDGKQSSMQPMIDEQKSDEKRLSLTLLEKNEDTSYSIEKTWKLGQKKNKAWNWYHSLYIQATHNLRGFVYKSSPSWSVYPDQQAISIVHFIAETLIMEFTWTSPGLLYRWLLLVRLLLVYQLQIALYSVHWTSLARWKQFCNHVLRLWRPAAL